MAAAAAGLLRSAHDASEGGLAVALAEAAIGGPYATRRDRRHARPRGYAPGVDLDGLLFGEDAGRVVGYRRIPRTATAWPSLPGGTSVSCSGPAARADRGWNCGRGPACSVGFWSLCERPISRRSRGGCSTPTRSARWENRRHVRHHRRLRHHGRGPAHATSASTPCSTAGRRAPGSWSVDREGSARAHRGMGLVSENFHDTELDRLPGDVAVGHTRYSTTGSTVLANAQPCSVNTRCGPLAIAHNGNLTNADRAEARAGGEGRHLHHLVGHRGAGPPDRALGRRTRSRARSGTRWSRWRAPTAW